MDLLPWKKPWFQFLLVILVIAGGWTVYKLGYPAAARAMGLPPPAIRPEVAAAIARADAAADAARAHAAQALRNQALARQAAAAAEDAAQKAKAKTQGYAEVAPLPGPGPVTYAYEGQVNAQGMPEGYVVVTFGDGHHYEGGWKDSAPQGYGVESFSDGRIHAGQWTAGQQVGDSVMVTSDLTWEGALIAATGKVVTYPGVLLCAADDNCRSEAGIFEVSSGAELKLEGPGVEVMKDGSTVKGVWKDGMQDGPGAVLDGTGNPLAQGLYENGALQSDFFSLD